MLPKNVIKALKCCSKCGADCTNCPAFKKEKMSDCAKVYKGALDIIKRQQAEIEKLSAAWIYKEDYMNFPVVQCPICGFTTVGINKYCAECGKKLKGNT